MLYDTQIFFSFFFFQAEDGIRDTSVTGVQTCALPIYRDWSGSDRPRAPDPPRWSETARRRSEERRVGKECRYRWEPNKIKKKKEKKNEERQQERQERMDGIEAGSEENETDIEVSEHNE